MARLLIFQGHPLGTATPSPLSNARVLFVCGSFPPASRLPLPGGALEGNHGILAVLLSLSASQTYRICLLRTKALRAVSGVDVVDRELWSSHIQSPSP